MENQTEDQTKGMNIWSIRVYVLIIIGFVIYATLTNGWESGTPQFIIMLMSLLTLVETVRPLLRKNKKPAQIAIAVLVVLFVLGILAFYFLG